MGEVLRDVDVGMSSCFRRQMCKGRTLSLQMSTAGVGGNNRLETREEVTRKGRDEPETRQIQHLYKGEQNAIYHPLAAISGLSVEGV